MKQEILKMTTRTYNFGKEDTRYINRELVKYATRGSSPITGIIDLVYMQPCKKCNTNFLPVAKDEVAVYSKSRWTRVTRRKFLIRLVSRAADIAKTVGFVDIVTTPADIIAADDLLMMYMPYFRSILGSSAP